MSSHNFSSAHGVTSLLLLIGCCKGFHWISGECVWVWESSDWVALALVWGLTAIKSESGGIVYREGFEKNVVMSKVQVRRATRCLERAHNETGIFRERKGGGDLYRIECARSSEEQAASIARHYIHVGIACSGMLRKVGEWDRAPVTCRL
jgi:hypothetical protein